MMPGDLESGLTTRGREVLSYARARGLHILKGPHAVRITGPGVDITVTSLNLLRLTDLLPPRPGERN